MSARWSIRSFSPQPNDANATETHSHTQTKTKFKLELLWQRSRQHFLAKKKRFHAHKSSSAALRIQMGMRDYLLNTLFESHRSFVMNFLKIEKRSPCLIFLAITWHIFNVSLYLTLIVQHCSVFNDHSIPDYSFRSSPREETFFFS